MAETPTTVLAFTGQCPDCGERTIELPRALPEVGDDFDWRTRDYDGFVRFMLEELVARYPERRRWTSGDLEVVLLEAIAAVLDQLSDMADRVGAEAFLESARRPESVRRLLAVIGYDAVRMAAARGEIDTGLSATAGEDALERHWLENPHAMDVARRAGPLAVHTQRRMVTVTDYAQRLEEHPLVLRAHAWSGWGGAWHVVHTTVVGWDNRNLDDGGTQALAYPEDIIAQVGRFHEERGLAIPPDWQAHPSIRAVLRPYVDAYRMAGQEVLLRDALRVGIGMSFSIRVAQDYFQSEVRRAVQQVLGTAPGGFFEPGRLRFGEDLYAADVFQVLMALDGVDSVCLNRFKRIGDQFPDRADSGQIFLDNLEIAVCDNDPAMPRRGYYRVKLHGGRRG